MTTVQHQRTVEVSRLRVDEVGDTLLVSTGGVHPATAAVARALPAENGRICVVMSDPALAYHPELGFRLCRWVPAHYESVRLIAPCAAVADQTGKIPAQVLSDLLEADVVAPDGELVATPGGALYVVSGEDGSAGGHWLRYRPGRPPLIAGRRFPVPEWERYLNDLPDPGIPELTVEQIPAGLWVRRTRSPAGRPQPTDLAFATPVQPDVVTLLVSRPGDPPLRGTDLRRLIEAMPATLLERLVVTPYGDHPVADGELGAVASVAANRTLRVRTGLPLQMAGRGQQVVAIDSEGNPTWIPFAREVAWRPHGGGRILSWTAPADQLLPAGAAQLMLNERWVVEIVEAGLWIREVNRTEGASAVRRLPLEAEHCTVVIGVGDEDQAQPSWRSVDRLLRRLPAEVFSRLRLAAPADAGEWFADAMGKGLRRVLNGLMPLLLTADGRLVDRNPGAPATSVGRSPSEPTEHEQVPAGQSSAGTPRRGKAAVDDVSTLLQYVDQIRRATAWDEEPAPGTPTAAPAAEAASTGEVVGEPGAPAVASVPLAPAAVPQAQPVVSPAPPAVPVGEGRQRPQQERQQERQSAPVSVPVPVSPPVAVPVPVAVALPSENAGPEPPALPARRTSAAPAEGDSVEKPNEEA